MKHHDTLQPSTSLAGLRKHGRLKQGIRRISFVSLVAAVCICNVLACSLFYNSRHQHVSSTLSARNVQEQVHAGTHHESNGYAWNGVSGFHYQHDMHFATHDEDVTTVSTTQMPATLKQPAATDEQVGEQNRNNDQQVKRLHSTTNRWRAHLNRLAEHARTKNMPRPPVVPRSAPKAPPKIFPDPNITQHQTDWPIWWMAPFFDRTSFGKEAAKLVLGMIRTGAVPEQNVWIGTTQGDCNYGVDTSMPAADFKQLDEANHRWNMSYSAIVVCHSLPPFWARPKNKWETCFPCPPVGYTPAITIGRAMAETDIYHSEFVKYCNRMDEVWVPSEFSRKTLERSGVPGDKLRVVPIAVNTTWYDPDRVDAIELPVGDLVFGQQRRSFVMSSSAHRTNGRMSHHQAADHIGQNPGTGMITVLSGTQGRAQSLNNGESVQMLTERKHHAPGFLRQASAYASDASRPGHTRDIRSNSKGHNIQQAGTAPKTQGITGQRISDQILRIENRISGKHRRLQVSSAENGAELREVPGEKAIESPSAEPTKIQFLPSSERHRVRSNTDPIVLLSCFKWEMRKGWDTLLAAYLQEFTWEDNVELYILTKPFMSAPGSFASEMQKWVKENLRPDSREYTRLPTLYVISHHITDMEYVGLLKAADAYVSATRGEGWGMPISEAMAMGLPVVVTNWSGVVDFVDESVGYMVDYNLTQIPNDQPWWFRGARWATASVDSMRSRLREVVSDRQAALRKGRRARERMVQKYSPEALAFLLAKEFNRLKVALRSGTCGAEGGCHNHTWVAPLGDTAQDLYTGHEEFIHRGEPQAAGLIPEEEKRKVKIPGAPQSPANAYRFFYKEMYPVVKAKNPKLAVTEVQKLIVEEWKKVSAAKKKAMADTYQKQMEQHRKDVEAFNANKQAAKPAKKA